MQFVWLSFIFLLAAYWDIRERRIPNRLIFTGLIGVCIFRYVSQGGYGIVRALSAGGIVVAIFFPLFLIRVFGAGDIKLFSLTAFMHGPRFAFVVCVCWFLPAGAVSLYKLLRNGRLYHRIVYAREYFFKGRDFRLPYYEKGRDDPADTIPMAPFLAVGYEAAMVGRGLGIW